MTRSDVPGGRHDRERANGGTLSRSGVCGLRLPLQLSRGRPDRSPGARVRRQAAVAPALAASRNAARRHARASRRPRAPRSASGSTPGSRRWRRSSIRGCAFRRSGSTASSRSRRSSSPTTGSRDFEFKTAVYDLMWTEGGDIGKPETLMAAAERVGTRPGRAEGSARRPLLRRARARRVQPGARDRHHEHADHLPRQNAHQRLALLRSAAVGDGEAGHAAAGSGDRRLGNAGSLIRMSAARQILPGARSSGQCRRFRHSPEATRRRSRR